MTLNIHEQLEFFLKLATRYKLHFSESKFIEMCGRDGVFHTVVRCDRIFERFELLKARGAI